MRRQFFLNHLTRTRWNFFLFFSLQLVATLAAAEISLQFEHRDLHWGNILIGKTDETQSLYILVDDKEYVIQSHGHTVSIIDFTMSRLYSGEFP